MILEAEPDITVVGEAGRRRRGASSWSPRGAARRRADGRAHAADGRHRGVPRGSATRRPATLPYVLMLTTFDLEDYVYAALRAGASGFLLKDAPAEQLVDGDRGRRPRRRAARAVGDPAADRGGRPPPGAATPARVPGLDRAHRARGRGAAADRPRHVQRRDRRRAVPRRGDREDPRRPGADQARRCATASRPSSLAYESGLVDARRDAALERAIRSTDSALASGCRRSHRGGGRRRDTPAVTNGGMTRNAPPPSSRPHPAAGRPPAPSTPSRSTASATARCAPSTASPSPSRPAGSPRSWGRRARARAR